MVVRSLGRLGTGRRISWALLSVTVVLLGMGVAAAPEPASATTPVGPVANLNAVPAPSGVGIALSWVNPTDADFAGVMIRRSNAASAPAPSSPTDGTLVATLAASDSSYVDATAVPQTRYYYAVFSHDAVPDYGPGDGVTATTTPFGWHSFGQIDAFVGEPSAISCPTSTFCMTADLSGRAIALVNGVKQPAVTLVDTSEDGPEFDGMTSVSCTASTFCVAANGNGLVFVYRGSTWSAPIALATGHIISSVSCVTTYFCKAAIDPNMVSTWNGTSWSTPTAATSASVHLLAISCTSRTFCAAIGAVTPAYPSTYTNYAIRWNGTSWGSPTKILAEGGDEVSSLSCVGASFCIAVASTGYWMRFNGKGWTTSQNMNNEATDRPSVSCTSASFCVLVGPAYPGGTSSRYNGSSWSAPVNLGDDTSFSYAVSCLATTCRVVDSTGVTRLGNGISWGSIYLFDPTHGDLVAVSCATTSFCIAVDRSGNFVRYNGSTWTAPARIAVTIGMLQSVSCPVVTFCMTVDTIGRIWTFNGTAWAQRPSDGLFQGAVSCASPVYCVAIDSGGSVAGFHGSTWTKPALIANGSQSYGVSCTSARVCGVLNLSTTAHVPDKLTVLSGGAWKSYSLSTSTSPRAVSCAGSGYCVVTSQNDLWVYAGGRVNRVPSSPLDENFRLSCVSVSDCVATGPGDGGAAAEYVINGSSVSPIASFSDLPPVGYESDISCVTQTWCMAADQFDLSVGTVPGV